MSRSKNIRTILFLGLIACFPLACSRQPPPDEPPPRAPVEAKGPLAILLGESTELLGTTQPVPNRVAKIATGVDGRVESVLRDASAQTLAEGQEVKAGTVVVQLDTRIITEQKRQADLAVQLADIEVKRLESLGLSGNPNAPIPLVSKIELQKARLSLEDAQSRQKGLQEQIKLYSLTAPIDGRLGLIQTVPGQPLAVGTIVAEVLDLSEIDVLCYVPRRTADRLKIDQQARIAQDADGGATTGPTGKVVFIAQQALPDTGMFAVKLRFANPKLALRANLVVRAQVLTKPEEERRTIPESALMEDTDPPGVIVIQDFKIEKDKDNKDVKVGKARKLRATVGVRDRALKVIEILSLEDPEKKEQVPVEDALFITKGGAGLEDGDLVKIDEEE